MEKETRGIYRIAELARVSIGTVDRALHGRGGIKESTRQRILEVAREIDYTPNLAARALSVAGTKLRVGVCMPRQIHFFYDQLWSGVLEEGRRVAPLGIELLTRPVRALGEDDIRAFEDLVREGVSGIIITAGNPRGLKPLINEAEEKGIRVVCVSTDAPDSRRSSIVCIEPRLNGSLAGELMGKFVPPQSRVAVVAGMLRTEDHRKKAEGFQEAFPRHCPGGKILNVVEGHEDEDETFKKTSELLRRVPSLAGIYVNTVNCLPVCRALGEMGLAGSIKLITTDLFAEMEPYFREGSITASIYQQPHRQGQLALRIMADNLIGKIPFPPTAHLSPGVVMSSNLHLFREMRQPAVARIDPAVLELAALA